MAHIADLAALSMCLIYSLPPAPESQSCISVRYLTDFLIFTSITYLIKLQNVKLQNFMP